MAKNLTTGSPLKLILLFTVPLLAGNLLQQLYNMADTAIVGLYLGKNALAGVGASSSVQFLVLGLCMGCCTGFSIPVAQSFGAGNLDRMKKFVFNGYVAMIALSLLVTISCTTFCSQILHLLRTPDDIFHEAWVYLVVLFAGCPFLMLYNFSAGILRAVGDSKTPLYFLSASIVLNIILDLAFILVFKMGVFGASFATILSQGLCGIVCFFWSSTKIDVLKLAREDMKFDPGMQKILFRMGIPMGLQFSITAIGSMVLQMANNSLGSLYISSFTLVTKFKQIFMSPFDALGVAVSTFASQNLGAGRIDRIRKGLFQATAISVLFGILEGFLFWFFGDRLCLFFISGSEKEVIHYAWVYAKALGIFIWSIGILNLWRPSLQGIGCSSKAMWGGFLELFARCFVTFVFVPSAGFKAVCYADPMAWLASTSFMVWYMVRWLKKAQKK